MIETQKDKLLKILDIQGISMEPIYGITFLKNKNSIAKPITLHSEITVEILQGPTAEYVSKWWKENRSD